MSADRFGAIDNTGPNTLLSYLRHAGTATSQIDIGVAFVTAAGLDSLLYALKRVAGRGRVRFLTGLYQGFTEPKALRVLLREQRETDGRLSVHISTDQHFHWKTYFLVRKSFADCIIGSSNLTDDGLRKTGEFNAVVSLPTKSKHYRQLHDVFDHHWASRSKSMTKDGLAEYEQWRSKTGLEFKNHTVPLSKILGDVQKPKEEKKGDGLFWRTCIGGYVSDETASLLSEVTDWDRKGLFFFSNSQSSSGDRVVLFDFNDKTVSIAEIKETTQTPRPTPDGRQFAAYRLVRGIPARKLVPKRWKSMKDLGLIRVKSDAYCTRKLSASTFQRFADSLKEVAK